MDFGIARAISDGTSTVTQTSAVVGTAQYLSPEQARGETVDSRSDVYSTGCLLYELLAGRPPFVGDSAFSVAYQHVRELAEPPSVHNPDLPPELDAIVMKALAKKVEDRYQSAADMRADIQRYLDGSSLDAGTVLAPVAPPVDAPPTSFFGGPVAEDEYPEEEPKGRRWQPVLLALLVLALLGGAIAVGIQLFGSGTVQVAVPKLTGLSLREAQSRLQVKGLQLGTVHRENSDLLPKGRVLSQDPVADSTVDKGAAVDLVVSAGTKQVVIKYVIGDTKQEAEQVLTGLGLNVRFETRDSDQPKDTVIETDPNAGETVDAGSTVTVVLSSGPVEVPNVVGLSESAARRKLEAAGFDVAVQRDETTPAKRGTVLSQDPDGLTDAPRGSTVEITVSDYTSPSPTPTPTATPTPSPSDTSTPSQTPSTSPSASVSP
jgi:serine/threonine-protein kinase